MGNFLKEAVSTVRHLPEILTDGHNSLKGRTYLFLSAILLVTILISASLAGGIDIWKDNEARRGNQILTSSPATDAAQFDYLIAAGVGRTLASGTVSTEDTCVTLPGDTYRGCFAYVSEQRERYETRVETYSCGTTKNPQTCTRTVSEWKNAGHQENQAETATILEVDLPYSFLRNSTRRADVSEVREPSNAFLRDNNMYFYESPTVRYSYRVAENTYQGTTWLNLASDGQITHLGGFWENETIEQVVERHTSEPVAPVVTHWIVQIFIILAALAGAIILVLRDLDDGYDHDF